IVCSDTAAHATTGTFTIYISASSSSTLVISTTSLASGTIGAFYSATLAATGGSGSYTWALTSGSLPTGLTLSTSGIIFGTPTVASTYSFKVLAYDSESHLITKNLSISISPVSAPTLAISTSSLASGVVGISYSATLAATSGSGSYTWALSTGSLPTGLTLNNSGVISGTPTTASTYNFTVLVYDTASNAITKAFSIIINPTLAISTSSLSNGIVDVQYSATLAAIGGTGPYTWALSTGNLPTGLTLSSGGVISGTPTTALTYNFTVLVTDTNSLTANKALSITVSPGIPLSITTSSLASGKTGANYSATLAATGGTNSYTWTLTDGSLPTGLTLSSTGVISGTPATAATNSFSITVTDTKSHTANKTLSITIAPEAVTTPSSNTTVSKPTSTSSNTTNKSGPTDNKSSFDFSILIIIVVAIVGLLIIARIIVMVLRKKRD
ncbi:MAG: putative Ig domain-containing protein, partial [Chloroflexi bacterium]|nr:putative Ig domain-containing protein [Chloroflexota bacterium]